MRLMTTRVARCIAHWLAHPGARAARALLVALAGCVPASRYHEPQAARPGAGAPSADAPSVGATTAALVGDWTGGYDAPQYARRGELRVSLRRVAPVGAGGVTTSLAGTASVCTRPAPACDGPDARPRWGDERTPARARLAVDSARVGRGRVTLWFAPYADPETDATVRLRLDGALAADTLGGRLWVEPAATVASEHHGGWRVVRVPAASRTTVSSFDRTPHRTSP